MPCLRRLNAILLVLIALCHLSSFGQNSKSDGIVGKLRTYNKQHVTEKAYLQFDKPYYATGDTLYFKAYVTMGERHYLSRISGVLHVDLIGIDNKANQSIKLQLVNGIGWGDFALPDSLPQGTYRVRAYTRWMRNAGDDSYFEKSIPIGSLHQSKIPESNTARVKPVLAKADLQFFPEGGELILGVNTKIAFKSIGVNGMGIDVKGTVADNSAKEITNFASTHLGMGSFYLKPEEGKSYKATITFGDGTKEELPLPQISNKGISLTINNDSVANAAVKIIANPAYFNENKGKTYSVLIYSGGIATTVSCKLDSPTITMDIIKRKLFTGITTVTLFSSNNEPIAERLIFVQTYDQLNLGVSTDKDTYATREKVSLKLNARTRADSTTKGHFSIAITDESKVQQDENNETTILTNLLLTSDLKGTVEQPNYYFADIGDQSNYDKQKELDLVMLTHGYRHFSWKQVLSGDSTITYQPETSLAITGTAKSLLGTPLKKATVTLISTQAKSFMSEVTDDSGRFNFNKLLFNDSAKFILQAVNSKGKNNTQLVYSQDKPISIYYFLDLNTGQSNDQVMSVYMANNEKQQEELNKQGLGNGKMLNEVKIKDHRNVDIKRVNALLGFPDQTLSQAKLQEMGGPLVSRLWGPLHRVNFIFNASKNIWMPVKRVPGAKRGVMEVWVNDIVMPGDFDINSIDPRFVVSVELYEDSNQGAGSIRITTSDDLQEKDVKPARTLKEVKIKGFKENNNYPSSVLGGAGNADQVIRRSDMSQGGNLSDQLDGRLTGGVRMVGRAGNKGPMLLDKPMLVVIDGAIINPQGELVDLDEHIPLSVVETVEILRSGNASIYGMMGGGGVMVITTRVGTNSEAKDIQSIGILPITVQGFYKAREFYAPKYETSITNNHPDLRSTIYWAPELVTDKDGKASIDFYNADGKGNYRVVVEGIDEKGNIGRRVYRYKVD